VLSNELWIPCSELFRTPRGRTKLPCDECNSAPVFFCMGCRLFSATVVQTMDKGRHFYMVLFSVQEISAFWGFWVTKYLWSMFAYAESNLHTFMHLYCRMFEHVCKETTLRLSEDLFRFYHFVEFWKITCSCKREGYELESDQCIEFLCSQECTRENRRSATKR
jgi:hypothetical protein